MSLTNTLSTTVSVIVLVLSVASCGGSDKPNEDGDTSTDAPEDSADLAVDTAIDTQGDTAITPDVQEDPEEDEAAIGCVNDSDCDDDEDCTVDVCEDDGSCSFTPDDGLCSGDLLCSETLGCVECLDDSGCDDEVDCTDDTCDEDGVCFFTAEDSDCTDDLVCSETLGCVECLDDASCEDSIDCTGDECDDDGACTFIPDDGLCSGELVCSTVLGCVECLDDTGCDDGLYCTGPETCDGAGSCVPGDAPCDDDIVCTRDICDEDLDSCSISLDHTRCDDTFYCNGTETCDPLLGDAVTGCLAGVDIVCDDSVDCTRDECSESTLDCIYTPVHTNCDVMTQICDPILDCLTLECIDDGDCDNDIACDGVETCVSYSCVGGTPVTCDDGFSCTDNLCSEPTGDCVFTPQDGACDDHLVCNGIETCDPSTGAAVTGCLDGTPPTCIDAHDCTVDSCSEAAGGCLFVPDDSECWDTDLCNGQEVCNVAVGCVPGPPVECDDAVDCTDDDCIPLTGTCVYTPQDTECDDGFTCTGVETCDPSGGCQAGTTVVCDDVVDCTVDTCEEPAGTCDYAPDHDLCGVGEVCLSTGCVLGTACTLPSDCDDGIYCNGEEICAGVCGGGTPVDCDDLNDCTVDTCSNTLETCVHTPQDLDGDGHGDMTCGGEDCNDTDPLINPDAMEICDGLDNDCDSTTDFGLTSNGLPCSDDFQCCSGMCAGFICTVGWGTCEGLGESCVVSAECCSGQCEVIAGGAMQCVARDACIIMGAPCELSAQCCSTFCQGGVCSAGICYMEGESCADSEECCSDNCISNICDDAGVYCRPEGEECTVSGVCCSGYCDTSIHRCVQLSLCSPSGSICLDDADCCTGYCEYDAPTDDSGTCLFVGTCAVVGQPCTGSSECCSNSCADPGFGYPVCVYLSGCRPYGEICSVASDCCSELCEPDGPVNRCQNPPGCQPDGEVCGDVATNNCCNLKSDGCRPTVAGAWRCFGTPVGGCFPDLAACTFSDECCCGLCAPDSLGDMVCCPGGITCIPDGDACTADIDCCSGYCVDGICGTDEDPCIELGGVCVLDIDCCSGNCVDGFCVTIDHT